MTLNLSNLCKYCGIFAFAILVSLPAAMAATPDEYEARISADKRDVAAYIGLLDAQIAAGQQKMAQTTQKRALRYAKAKSQKLVLRTQGIKIWRLSGDRKKALREYRRGVKIKTPDSKADLHLAMARVYFDLRLFEEAKEMLRLSLDADAMNN